MHIRECHFLFRPQFKDLHVLIMHNKKSLMTIIGNCSPIFAWIFSVYLGPTLIVLHFFTFFGQYRTRLSCDYKQASFGIIQCALDVEISFRLEKKDRVNQSTLFLGSIMTFFFRLTKTSFLTFMMEKIDIIFWTWCFFHNGHLICKNWSTGKVKNCWFF